MKKIILVFIILLVQFQVMVSTVSASPVVFVNLAVAYDEEFACTAFLNYAYTPQTLASILIDETFYHFYHSFDIYYQIIAYKFWDSDDSVTDCDLVMDESITETGFYTGMYIGSKRVDVLVAFTDQDIADEYSDVYGNSDKELGVVLVEETYLIGVIDGIGPVCEQATDNILQHELSHLYDVTGHGLYGVAGLDCVMNGYPLVFNIFEYIPTALVTDNWCAQCIEEIAAHRTWWGAVNDGGGGGPPCEAWSTRAIAP